MLSNLLFQINTWYTRPMCTQGWPIWSKFTTSNWAFFEVFTTAVYSTWTVNFITSICT